MPRDRSRPRAAMLVRSAAAIASIAPAACCAHAGGVRQRHFGVRKRRQQGRPDLAAQAVARQADVVVALVVEPAQPMRARVALDRLARRFEPGPHPSDAVATYPLRHCRERGDAAAAQCLEQKGLGLVAAMVAEEDEVDAARERHPAQGAVAHLARPRLDAVAGLRSLHDSLGDELDRLAGARPAPHSGPGNAPARRRRSRSGRDGRAARAPRCRAARRRPASRAAARSNRARRCRRRRPVAPGFRRQRAVVSLKRP